MKLQGPGLLMLGSYLRELFTALWVNQVERYRAWRARRARYLWRCVRDGGGGSMVTPKPMTEEHAIAWLARVTNGEVIHVDRDYRHIFYRSARSS